MERKYYKGLIRQALHEDLDSRGDITSNSIFTGKERGVFTLIAKDDGILCGLAPFAETFHQLNRHVRIEPYFADGDRITKGTIVARVRGKLTAILTGERTALNIVSHLSGISTKAARFVAVAGAKPVVLDTRKTIPGLRRLQKYAVSTGGATSHRTGLYDMVLIKDNHIDAAGGIEKAVACVRSKWGKRFKIEVETRNLDEVSQAIKAGADRIMLDNMTNQMMKEAVELIGGRAETEASGNMTLERLPTLPETGIDFVSFGELTHTVKVFDFSLKQESVE
jgi:nicotinate-nucleotide pyrophosphorylase (carboxylating)